MERKIIDITALGLAADGFYHVKNDESIYLIKSDCKVVVENGIKAIIIDESANSNIYFNCLDDSSTDYFIVKSKSTKRTFDLNGELNITEILLDESNEEFNCDLLKENANVNKKLLSFSNGMIQNVIERVNHNKNKTFSNISNTGVSMNGGKIRFDITGFIQRGMSTSNCRQLSRGIVMDDNSEVVAKPILLIDEFDCFASHGATIGKMSDEDLFYLMSRGLNKNEAFLLILGGMIKPFIDQIPSEELKNDIENKINEMIEK